jgi:hypothetical protein
VRTAFVPTASALPGTDPIVIAINADRWSVAAANPPTMQPASSLLFARLTRQGFDASGQAVTFSKELILTQRVRLPLPNQAQLDALRVALSGYVCATEVVRDGQPNNSTEVSPEPVAR